MDTPARDGRSHLRLVTDDAVTERRAQPTPKQHPPGVWDLPTAGASRRTVAVFPDGNLAMEVNVSDRVPESVHRDVRVFLERALEEALRSLKV